MITNADFTSYANDNIPYTTGETLAEVINKVGIGSQNFTSVIDSKSNASHFKQMPSTSKLYRIFGNWNQQ